MKKRITALILALLTASCLIGCNGVANATADRLLGDADNNNTITIADATQVQRHLAHIISLDAESLLAADVDGNGEVTISDATFIQKWLVHQNIPYTVGEPVQSYQTAKTAAVNALSGRLAQTKAAANGKPVLIRSYDTDNQQLSITAYTYDNALTAMAFIAEDRASDAEAILDAFVYAAAHDRYQPGRIRNTYASDTVYYNDNGTDSVKLPGWWDASANLWREDPTQIGCNTGNTSYAALALLQYDSVYHTDKYLATAKALMDWVLTECKSSGNGFTGGYNGWKENGDVTALTYLSVEHNLDAYSVFKQLYAVTNEQKYKTAADSALAFIQSMYSSEGGYFYMGTGKDGVTINDSAVVLDAQVWSAMALGDEFAPYEAALDKAASMKTAEGAYPFCLENKNGGFWCEGSAFTALNCRLRGDTAGYSATMNALCAVQLDSGLFPAATVDNLATGIILDTGTPWEYNQDPHIAPAAWFVMAADGFNPYTF